MYNPKRFKSENRDEIYAFMDLYPFATLVTATEAQPFISHLPLTVRRTGGGAFELTGHVARANPHWRLLEKGPSTAVFHGPNAYITPAWYTKSDVPTWNYSTVHARGSVHLIEDDTGVEECLKQLSTHVEKHWPSGWRYFLPDDLKHGALTKAIVGFRMRVAEVDYKKKLGQSLRPDDRAGVLRGLSSRTDDGSRGVLAEMTKMYSHGGGSSDDEL